MAVDTRRISIASDTDDVSEIHVMLVCIPTVTPMLAAAPPLRSLRRDLAVTVA